MKDVFIVDAGRTGIGSFGGTLADVSAVELGKIVVSDLLKRNNLDGKNVDELIFGNVLQAGLGQNVARQVAVAADIPVEKSAITINMVCGSGLRTVAMGAQSIKCDDASIVVVGGTENMSSAPYILKKARTGYRMGNGELVPSDLNTCIHFSCEFYFKTTC